jgi:hypothetical protein
MQSHLVAPASRRLFALDVVVELVAAGSVLSNRAAVASGFEFVFESAVEFVAAACFFLGGRL